MVEDKYEIHVGDDADFVKVNGCYFGIDEIPCPHRLNHGMWLRAHGFFQMKCKCHEMKVEREIWMKEVFTALVLVVVTKLPEWFKVEPKLMEQFVSSMAREKPVKIETFEHFIIQEACRWYKEHLLEEDVEPNITKDDVTERFHYVVAPASASAFMNEVVGYMGERV